MPKLSDIVAGFNLNPATDKIVAVRNGVTDVLVNPFAGGRVATASPVSMTSADLIVEVALTTPAACTVNLPTSPTPWQLYTVKDGANNSETYPITLVPPNGAIDGQSTYVINSNSAAVDFYWNGAAWRLK